MVRQIYPLEFQLNQANASDTKAAFLDMHLSISSDIVSTKIYDKREDFDFEIVNFPFLDMMFLALHPMESISRNASVLLEHLAMLLTLTLAINCLHIIVSSIKFRKGFAKFLIPIALFKKFLSYI